MWNILKRLFSSPTLVASQPSSPGEHLENQIREFLASRFPNDSGWQDEQFHCFAGVPLELRMIPAFDALEYNIGNGGWSQVLWNCFGTWRELVRIGTEGYALTGATENVAAMGTLRSLLEANEVECREFMHLADVEDDFSYFAKFTARSYGTPVQEWERCFYFDSDLEERRYTWLHANSARIQRLISA